jgi:hypothetical protein
VPQPELAWNQRPGGGSYEMWANSTGKLQNREHRRSGIPADLSELRDDATGNHAHRRMPILLRVHALQGAAPPEER